MKHHTSNHKTHYLATLTGHARTITTLPTHTQHTHLSLGTFKVLPALYHRRTSINRHGDTRLQPRDGPSPVLCTPSSCMIRLFEERRHGLGPGWIVWVPSEWGARPSLSSHIQPCVRGTKGSVGLRGLMLSIYVAWEMGCQGREHGSWWR